MRACKNTSTGLNILDSSSAEYFQIYNALKKYFAVFSTIIHIYLANSKVLCVENLE
jgi:hypothetical protein